MVDESDDKYELPDDGEYHFSDDQGNYDVEPESVKISEPNAKTGTATLTGINQYRRPLIGIVVFIILIFLVYKLIAPASSPVNQFTPTANQLTQVKPANKITANQTPVATTAQQQPITVAPIQQRTTPLSEPVPNIANTQANVPANVPITSQAAPASQNSTAETLASETGYGETASTSSVEKLLLLQQQNTKLINQFQEETSQRISGYQAQAAQMDSKIQELGMHISKIETTLAQLGKTIQELKTGGSVSMQANMENNTAQPVRLLTPSGRSVPHVNYTVQAIIPGRAWLKSESGETITVAEGDILKNAGRIMKIDPYDGVVEIDMNGKIISLSYGSNGDS